MMENQINTENNLQSIDSQTVKDSESNNSKRLQWSELPEKIKDYVQQELGATVISASDQDGGFSLGTAAVLNSAQGAVSFVKAIDGSVYGQTAELYRQEAKILAVMDATAPVAGLQKFSEYEQWSIVLIDPVENSYTPQQWSVDEIKASFQALDILAKMPVQSSTPLESLPESLGQEANMWQIICEQQPTAQNFSALRQQTQINQDYVEELTGWLPELNKLAEPISAYLQKNVHPFLAGSALQHTDIRSDNILIYRTNEQVFQAKIVDWAWGCLGNPAYDSACLVAEIIAHHAEITCDELVAYSHVLTQSNPAFIRGVVMLLAGYYLSAAQHPAHHSTLDHLPSERFRRAYALSRWILENQECIIS